MTRLHAIVAAFACVVIPGWSWADGSGWLAWTMYSKSETYRVRVVARDASGALRRIAPTQLGTLGSRELTIYLSGSERWRHAPAGNALRRFLPELARLGCRIGSPASVEVTLEQRRTLDAPVQTSSARAECAAASDGAGSTAR